MRSYCIFKQEEEMQNIHDGFIILDISGEKIKIHKDVLMGSRVSRTENYLSCHYFKALLTDNFKQRDEYFIDTDPECFKIILNHLRGYELDGATFSDYQRSILLQDCDYYGISTLKSILEGKCLVAKTKDSFNVSGDKSITLGCGSESFSPNSSINSIVYLKYESKVYNFEPGTKFGKVVISLKSDIYNWTNDYQNGGYTCDDDIDLLFNVVLIVDLGSNETQRNNIEQKNHIDKFQKGHISIFCLTHEVRLLPNFFNNNSTAYIITCT